MLFKTKDKIIEYADLLGTTNFASVKPTIKFVEQQHIIPILGDDLYNTLNDAYTEAANEDSLEEPILNLLEQCRSVVGPMLCYYYAPKSEVKLSDAGAQRMETANAKTAYQNQVTNFREQNLRQAEMATESLLEFLEKNKEDYEEWTDSDAFKDYRSLFIKSGKEFDKLFTSSSPYRNYWAMRSQMLDVEENSIRSLLGDALFDALKEKDQDPGGEFSDKEKKLLDKLKRVIAFLTVAGAIPLLNVRIDGNGITVMNTSRGQDDALSKIGAANDKALNVIVEKCQAAATSWINNVTKYLDDNAADFEGWTVTDTNINSNETDANRENNDFSESCGSYGLV